MVNLEAAAPHIQKLLSAISKSLNVEAAVFDRNCQLIAYTSKYLQHKGRQVHTPSLEEVFTQDDILVNEPGHMPSCFGCRFKEACPATIELLHSIKVDDNPVGAIALTAFNADGQKRIMRHLETYHAVLRDTAELIAVLSSQGSNYGSSLDALEPMRGAMDASSDCIFCIDSTGTIVYSNSAAGQMFPQCFSYPGLLHRLLPSEVLAEVLAGNWITNKLIKTRNFSARLSCLPIKNRHQITGAIIQVNQPLKTVDFDAIGSTRLAAEALNGIVGTSETIADLKNRVRKIAPSKASVLLTGESGTGKELFARAIHQASTRAAFPFIPINCAAIPETLFESELFGYDEGAFTGAKKGGKPGLIEIANKGTLFLDEIGDMPKYMQAKLLRVLQDFAVTRVGGLRPTPVDVRIIAATNQNIEEKVAKNEFRLDLFYRLNVIPLYIPPLRQRKEDIEALAKHFLLRYGSDPRHTRFSAETLALFQSHEWPGNARELENIVEHAIAMESGKIITPASLPASFLTRQPPSEIKERLGGIEADIIRSTIDKYGWNLSGKKSAAKELGIGLRTLYRKLEEQPNNSQA